MEIFLRLCFFERPSLCDGRFSLFWRVVKPMCEEGKDTGKGERVCGYMAEKMAEISEKGFTNP